MHRSYNSIVYDSGSDPIIGSSGSYFTGNTHTAATANYSDVLNAYNLCSDTDILIVPSGSATWSSPLNITKGIKVQKIGTGTIISGVSGGCITYDPANYNANNAFRLTGFTFDANGNSILGLGHYLKDAPFALQTKVRVDHNSFTNSSGTMVVGQAIWDYGNLYGVVDHNVFTGMGAPLSHQYSTLNDTWWANSPQNVFAHGSANYMIYEDNTFDILAYAGISILTVGSEAHRYVFRYNDITTENDFYPLIDMHGQQGESPGMPAGFGAEMYGNLVHASTHSGDFFKQRSGQVLVFFNNIIGSGSYDNDAYTGGLDTCPLTYPALKNTHNTYWWGNRKNTIGAFWASNCDGGLTCNGLANIPTAGRDVFHDTSTPGVTSGNALPGTCSVGQGFWLTNQSTSDLTGLTGPDCATPIAGTLYRCLSTNVWTAYCSPYTYPHPLQVMT